MIAGPNDDEDDDIDEGDDYILPGEDDDTPPYNLPDIYDLDFAGSCRCLTCSAEFYLFWDESFATGKGPQYCSFCGAECPSEEIDPSEFS